MKNQSNGADAGEIQYAVGECALGLVLVAWSDNGICAVLLGDDPDELRRDLHSRFPHSSVRAGQENEGYLSRVAATIGSPLAALDLPLAPRGTVFQQRVWQALREIPVGVTETYTALANRIGQPKAVRAVAQACAANPLAVVVPCHRVLRSDGALSGYRWGVERKRWLLEKEARVMTARRHLPTT